MDWMVLLTLIGVTVSHDGLQQVCWHDTDNTACIEWGNHIIGGRERAKHIDIWKHFAHEAIQNRHMRLIRVSTDEQLADIFTMALPFPQFEKCLMGLMGGDLKPKGP